MEDERLRWEKFKWGEAGAINAFYTNGLVGGGWEGERPTVVTINAESIHLTCHL
jgi:hypothetical protein